MPQRKVIGIGADGVPGNLWGLAGALSGKVNQISHNSAIQPRMFEAPRLQSLILRLPGETHFRRFPWFQCSRSS